MRQKTKVQVWLYRRNEDTIEFLLLKRPKGYKTGEFWQPVTGNIDANEDPQQAARREVAEETALTDTEKIFDTGHVCYFSKGDKQITEYVFGCPTCGEGIQISHEHSRYQWMEHAPARDILSFETNRVGLDAVVKIIQNR